jgi:hypothetical protein
MHSPEVIHQQMHFHVASVSGPPSFSSTQRKGLQMKRVRPERYLEVFSNVAIGILTTGLPVHSWAVITVIGVI